MKQFCLQLISDPATLFLEAKSCLPEGQSSTISKEGDLSGDPNSLSEQKIEDDSPWEISSHSSSDTASSTQDNRGRAVSYQGASISIPNFEKALTVAAPMPDSGPLPNLEQFYNSIKFTITCLFNLLIRHPAPLDRLRQKTFSNPSPFQHFDILYIRDKFPKLNADVSSRLGKMVTLRRQLLHLRDTHSRNLELDESQAGSSVIASLKPKATILENFGRPTEENLNAPSITESKPSNASSYTERELTIGIPPRPRGENGDELDYFVCPYCRVVKRIKTIYQWEYDTS